MAYVMQLDELEREAAHLMMSAAVARGMGGDVEVPSMAWVRQRFDELLAEPPLAVTLDPDQYALRHALGLATR